MVHSASGSYSHHKVADVLLHAEELRSKNEILAAILAQHLGSHTSTAEVMALWANDTCAMNAAWLIKSSQPIMRISR
jgi:hypothetical protein